MKHWQMNRLKDFFFSSPVLVLTAAAMVLDLIVCVAGLLTDHTIITGLPAWDKPTKFAISTGIYALSLVVIIRFTAVWKRTLRLVELLTGLALLLEVVLIDLQAARHTTSHFNVSTPFNRHVFVAVGTGIGVLWVCAIVLAIATFRTRYRTPAWTVAVRCGMLLAVLGGGSGAFMAAPSRAQIEQAKLTHQMPLSGSHTIGGPDGGKGLPVLGWSTQHGDVRPAHFMGLHAMQLFALLVLFLERCQVPQRKAKRIVSVTIASYGSLFLILLFEALLTKPLTAHSSIVLAVWAIWASLSAAILVHGMRTGSAEGSPAVATSFSVHA